MAASWYFEAMATIVFAASACTVSLLCMLCAHVFVQCMQDECRSLAVVGVPQLCCTKAVGRGNQCNVSPACFAAVASDATALTKQCTEEGPCQTA